MDIAYKDEDIFPKEIESNYLIEEKVEEVNTKIDSESNSQKKDDLKSYFESRLFENKPNMTIEEFGPSQFKYMTLFSNGISRREIADYYNVAYDTVKKSLQVICDKYNGSTAEECIDAFKKQWSSHSKYKNVLSHFNESNKLGVYIGQESSYNSKDLLDDSKENLLNGCIGREHIIKITREAILFKKEISIEYSDSRKKFNLRPINYYESKGTYYLKAIDLNGEQVKIFKFEKIYYISIK